VLFGCGGDRDATKRPRMAKVAQKFADDIYITSDNPRSENPQSIIDQILAGFSAEHRAAVRVNPDRAACIAHYGNTCQVCSFNFGKTYGQLGDGFIHVHHIAPLRTVGQRCRVDPINDLIPVCPNCHAMLHWGTNPPSVEQLRRKVRRPRT
jgi:hypothetical protein